MFSADERVSMFEKLTHPRRAESGFIRHLTDRLERAGINWQMRTFYSHGPVKLRNIRALAEGRT